MHDGAFFFPPNLGITSVASADLGVQNLPRMCDLHRAATLQVQPGEVKFDLNVIVPPLGTEASAMAS